MFFSGKNLRFLPSFLFPKNMLHYKMCRYGFIFHRSEEI